MEKHLVPIESIKAAFMFRHAAKRFDSAKIIPAAEFDVILEAARLSPSSFGLEPWDIIVVHDTKLLAEFREVAWGAQGQLPTASHCVVMTAKTSEAMQPNAPHAQHLLRDVRGLSNEEADEYQMVWYKNWLTDDFGRLEAPQLLHEWAARQAYIAAGNMMTVAAMRGIDSCPIEGFNIEKVTSLLVDRKLINPAQDLPVLMLAFGYRIDSPRRKTRRPIAEIVSEV